MTARAFLLLALFGWLTAAALFTAGVAKADPITDYATTNADAVCSTLHDYPTVDGVTGILAAVIEHSGFSPYQAGRTVAMAVTLECPQYIPILQKFVDRYAPAPEFSKGYIA